jgi:hypothetical protein
VIYPIPAGGLGEVAALVEDSVTLRRARSSGTKCRERAQVKVLGMVGSTLLVESN